MMNYKEFVKKYYFVLIIMSKDFDIFMSANNETIDC